MGCVGSQRRQDSSSINLVIIQNVPLILLIIIAIFIKYPETSDSRLSNNVCIDLNYNNYFLEKLIRFYKRVF